MHIQVTWRSVLFGKLIDTTRMHAPIIHFGKTVISTWPHWQKSNAIYDTCRPDLIFVSGVVC